MAKMTFRVEIDEKGVGEILKSESMAEVLTERAQKIADAAKDMSSDPDCEYKVNTFVGRDRVRAHVKTASPAAKLEEATNRTLSIAAGRFYA